MEGRQILDAALIVNEVGDTMFRRKDSGVLCKFCFDEKLDICIDEASFVILLPESKLKSLAIPPKT